ncbi:MAG: MBOAT family protein [Spirochaetes bacterium]|nr:MBOAT family protein [Spirochaetota bacterium]
MGFSSITFLFYFLPAAILAYFVVPRGSRRILLLAASYAFYLWGSPIGAAILIVSTVLDFILARAMLAADAGKSRKLLLASAVSINVAILFYYKYSNFFIGEFNNALAHFHVTAVPWTAVVFPLGISFITFHKISYLVDIYNGTAPPTRRLADYALYLALFPKLLQGPIMRYGPLAKEIAKPESGLGNAFEGAVRFCVGLGKKVLIADVLGPVVDRIFLLESQSLTVGYAWIGAIFYTFQIYFDFSGYTDMAIGIGRILGFSFTENFNRPYISRNFTEFWRRWHITLGAWFREYLYIPLGGNRAGAARTYLNLWIVFFVSGLWHGANWTFIVWGLFHGFFMFLDRVFWIEKSKKLPAALNIVTTFLLLVVGWVFFRSDTIGGAFAYLGRMFEFWNIHAIETTVLPAQLVGNREAFILVFAAAVSFFPDGWWQALRNAARIRVREWGLTAMKAFAAFLLLLLSAISLLNNSFSPFIYFRF